MGAISTFFLMGITLYFVYGQGEHEMIDNPAHSTLSSDALLNKYRSVLHQDMARRLMEGRAADRLSHESKPDSRRVMIVTSLHQTPCHGVVGAYLSMLALKNKQDYADLHGHQLYWSVDEPDPEMKGAWNKIAILNMLAHKHSKDEVEWFLWLDEDSIFLDVNYTLPLHKQRGDLVFWAGDKHGPPPSCITDEHDAMCYNSGTILVRNTEWSRNFLEELSRDYGRKWSSFYEGRPSYQMMKDEVKNFDWALFDQAGIAHVFKQHPEWRDKVEYDHSKDLHQLWGYGFKGVEDLARREELPFVAHWAGCQFCRTGGSSLERSNHVRSCVSSFMDVYDLSREVTAKEVVGTGTMDMHAIKKILSDSLDHEDEDKMSGHVHRWNRKHFKKLRHLRH